MGLGRDAPAGVEARVGATVQLGEVGANAGPGVRMRRIHGADLDHGRGEEPLDLRHRRDQAVALAARQRRQERPRQLVAALVEDRSLGESGRGQLRHPDPAVRPALHHLDQTVGFQRAQEAARMAGIQLEPGSQRPYLAAVRAHLPQEARLGEWAIAREKRSFRAPTRWVTLRLKRRTCSTGVARIL